MQSLRHKGVAMDHALPASPAWATTASVLRPLWIAVRSADAATGKLLQQLNNPSTQHTLARGLPMPLQELAAAPLLRRLNELDFHETMNAVAPAPR
jgi:hypothetical protein